MKRRYCTYFDRNYLVRVIALIQSLNRHHRDEFELFAVCMDEISRVILAALNLPNVRLVPLHEIEWRDAALLATKKQRSLVEYYWTMTPTITLRMLERLEPGDVLTYLDADLYFFSAPDPIFAELGDASILIHEHRLSPHLAHIAKRNGKFNVGLLCFRKDADGLEALRWWRERCLEWCFKRCENGKFGDQMYLDDWPQRFRRLVVLQHIGAGTAPWNHDQYRFSRDDAGQVRVNDLPLVFYHVQALGLMGKHVVLPARQGDYLLTEPILKHCYLPYIEELMKAIELVRQVLSDFEFGMSEENVMTPHHTFVARRKLRQQIETVRLPHKRAPLSAEWDAYHSAQTIDLNRIVGDDTVESAAGRVK